jgi:hypothetical protein
MITFLFNNLKVERAFIINDRKVGPWTQRIYDALTAIQWGTSPDPFGWMVSVEWTGSNVGHAEPERRGQKS